jgi:hypothetical protein
MCVVVLNIPYHKFSFHITEKPPWGHLANRPPKADSQSSICIRKPIEDAGVVANCFSTLAVSSGLDPRRLPDVEYRIKR